MDYSPKGPVSCVTLWSKGNSYTHTPGIPCSLKLPHYFLNALLYKTQFFEVYLCCDNSAFFLLFRKKKKRPLHTLSVFVINHISYSIYWELLLHRFFELIRIIFLWSWYFPYHWPPSSTVILGLIFHYLNHWLVIKLEAVCVLSFNHIPLSSPSKLKTWIRTNDWLHIHCQRKISSYTDQCWYISFIFSYHLRSLQSEQP